ncbi:helix-turn-helix domain-containing protein [Anditalea andensis]|uniref:HTH cro/C1-type domain-containing protein n=1 Tax=Anditalea andensis TaxID=1048983 RepID=A0A074LD10_9BACT|nr:helix-turn-helix transcriptional regulator [Anditalea andensis]KEO71652.1 hypothetical protein EL17_23515 [Anditalea andensis]
MKGDRGKYIDLKRLAENLGSLREQANLSIMGLEVVIGFSSDHLRQLENENNTVYPNTSTLSAFATLYDVTIDDLLKKKDVKLGSNLTLLNNFFTKHTLNDEYKFDKNSLPSFIKKHVLTLPQMIEGIRVSEIMKLFPDRNLNSKELSRELNRLYIKGIIDKFDKTGKGSVFFYRLKK